VVLSIFIRPYSAAWLRACHHRVDPRAFEVNAEKFCPSLTRLCHFRLTLRHKAVDSWLAKGHCRGEIARSSLPQEGLGRPTKRCAKVVFAGEDQFAVEVNVNETWSERAASQVDGFAFGGGHREVVEYLGDCAVAHKHAGLSFGGSFGVEEREIIEKFVGHARRLTGLSLDRREHATKTGSGLKTPAFVSDLSCMLHEATTLTDELRILETKLKALRRDYEQYFLGSRPREPQTLRAELQKAMFRLGNGVIRNTGERFKYNTINSQFLTYKRHWDETLRKMEAGTYKRQVFKANIRDRARGHLLSETNATAPKSGPDDTRQSDSSEIYASYIDAAKLCGQNVSGLTPEKLHAAIEKQARAIKKKLGVNDVSFRVEVVEGKVKLKARAAKAS
jgi:hypothetical protein